MDEGSQSPSQNRLERFIREELKSVSIWILEVFYHRTFLVQDL
ncbi:MAG: hypothetical protein PHD56_00550 [Anaerostipes sp.]|nr:hypothetical protein [Anaerostipes sp.]